ncbi:MAG TPA: glycosyltransferase family 4 protein [Nitrospiraceae bacterium]|jgi:glycosyltransferase involved in cell wall biosynthesis|nr:glycosyltransferase family 4 protein [Nitrospiraceae bacterium]
MSKNGYRILHTESSTARGGQEFRVLQEALGMIARGHRVVLAAPWNSWLSAEGLKQGLPVVTIGRTWIQWPFTMAVLQRAMRRERIQIVQCHGSADSWAAALVARSIPQRPLVVQVRHKSTAVRNSVLHRWAYRRGYAAIVTTGEAVRRRLLEQFQLDPSKIVSIPTGVDLERFAVRSSNDVLRHSFGWNRDHCLVGTVAFLRSYKGLEVLIEAAAKLRQRYPRIRFVIAGEGEEQPKISSRIRELGLQDRVVLTGYWEDVPGLLAMLDIYVQPSLKDEGVPQGVVQALAMERAVVATAVGGTGEVILPGRTGLLIEPGSAEALAQAVSALVENVDLRSRLAREGRQHVLRSYSAQEMLRKTEQLYEHLMGTA